MQAKYCTVSVLLRFLAAKLQRKTKTTDLNDFVARMHLEKMMPFLTISLQVF